MKNWIWIAPVTAMLLAATSVFAQDQFGGFPAERMRFVRTDLHVPDTTYMQNRVVLRSIQVSPSGGGMQISGEVITDFEADIVPADEANLPRGQMAMRVDIELLQFDVELTRTGGVVNDPQINVTRPDRPGVLIPGQQITVTTSERFANFGLARFALPPLERPLAPGFYALAARVMFSGQPGGIQPALKWCSDLFGQEEVFDPDTGEVEWRRIVEMPERHEYFYGEILNTIRRVESFAMFYVGELIQRGSVELIPPGEGRRQPNITLWTPHMQVVTQIQQFQYQRDNAAEIVARQNEARRNIDWPPLPADAERAAIERQRRQELMERWEQEEAGEEERLRRVGADGVARFGGPVSADEANMVRGAMAARPVVLEQIGAFYDLLTHRYWVLTDGHLQYALHRVNRPGWHVWEAIEAGDVGKSRRERLERLDQQREGDDRARSALWERRRQEWRFQPRETREIAFAYLRELEERGTFDAENFARRVGQKVELRLDRWTEYRQQMTERLMESTEPIFNEITTTTRYINQVWPDALREARAARDLVITLAYAYEFTIRTTKMEHDRELVFQSWRDEDAQNTNQSLDRYYAAAQATPAVIQGRFNNAVNQVKRHTGEPMFRHRYRAAVEASDATGRTAPLPGETTIRRDD